MDKSIVAALHLTLNHKYRCLTITPTVLQRPGYPVPQVPRPSSLHFYTVTICCFTFSDTGQRPKVPECLLAKLQDYDARFGMLSYLIYTNVWNAITLVRPIKEVVFDSSSTHNLMLLNKKYN